MATKQKGGIGKDVNKGTYFRSLGWLPDDRGGFKQPKFWLGRDQAEAEWAACPDPFGVMQGRGAAGRPDRWDGRPPDVLADTMAALADARWRLALLPPWYDVDTTEDWEMLCGHLAALRRAGIDAGTPHLDAFIREAAGASGPVGGQGP